MIKSLDQYWRLDRFSAIKGTAAFNLHRTQGATRLCFPFTTDEIYNRIRNRTKSGMMDYTKCTNEELNRFFADRKLGPPLPLRTPRPEMHTLQHFPLYFKELYLFLDDDSPSFILFPQLPPEIQRMVVECYVSGFPRVLETPSQPPLARTCRSMRNMVLPVFYRTCVFTIPVCYRPRTSHRGLSGRDRSRVILCQDSIHWLSHLRPVDFTYLAAVNLRVDSRNDCRPGSVRIRYDPSTREYSVKLHGFLDPLQYKTLRAENVQVAVRSVIARINARERPSSLRLEDIYALRTALEPLKTQ